MAVRKIQLKDAKANFSSVVDDAIQGKPSIITRHGKRAAVVVGYDEWTRLTHVPSFGRLLIGLPADLRTDRDQAPLRDADL